MKSIEEYLNKEEKVEERCCENPSIDINGGNKVCINCGTVLDFYLVGHQRRAYNDEDIKKRIQNEPCWREFGSRTVLSSNKTDYKGHHLTAEKKTLFLRLSKIQNSLISGIERNFWEAKPKMKQFTLKLNIPDYINETAWKIYSLTAKKKLTMGRSIDGFLTASLYVAVRVHEFPKLLDEISDITMVPRKSIVNCLGLLLREVLPELNLSYKPISVKQLIFKFGNELGLSLKIQKNALNILSNTAKIGFLINGKDPRGLAASALYLAAKKTKERKTQTEIAELAKITEVTLRTRINEIKNNLTLML